MPDLLKAALVYAVYGWPVFPLAVRGKEPLIQAAHPEGDPLRGHCKGQCDRDGHGLHDATTNAERVRAWWHRWPRANVGIRTGAVSNLLVVDIDPDKGGAESLARLEVEHGALLTREAETGSAGAHLYFCHAGQLGNSSGRLGRGLDTRGDGGYVVGPPSVHPSGGTYRWCTAYRRIEVPPTWLAAMLRPPERPPAPKMPAVAGAGPKVRYLEAAITGILDHLATVLEGQRNHELYRAGCRVRELIQYHGAPLAWVAVIEQAGCAMGLPKVEVRRTVASAMRSGAA